MALRGPSAGIALKLLATLSFTLMYVFIKLAGDVHFTQAVFYRCLFSLPVVFVVAHFTIGMSEMVKTKRPLVHLSRALVGLTALTMTVTATIYYLPLADVTAFGFVMPIFAVIMAAIILKEDVGAWRWGAVIVGFGGVMLMCEPHGGILGIIANLYGQSVGAALALGGALMSSFVVIFVRQMNSTEKSETIVFYFMGISTLISGVAMLFAYEPLTWIQILFLILSGIAGGIGQVAMTYGYRFAEPSLLASFDFTSMVWATLFGYLLFAEVPAVIMLVGAAIVIASGSFIAWREHRQRKDEVVSATPSV